MSENIKTKFISIVDEAWNKGNLDRLNELHSADYIQHRTPFPDIVGLDAFKQEVAATRLNFPDFYLTTHELILEGDNLAVRFSWTGTHSGQSKNLPIPPTGKQITVSGSQILHLHGNKLVEGWQFADYLGLFQQLGLVPQPGRGE